MVDSTAHAWYSTSIYGCPLYGIIRVFTHVIGNTIIILGVSEWTSCAKAREHMSLYKD